MNRLHIDIETYGEVNLARTGVYRYAEDKSFEILLFGYSVDEGAVEVVDLANGEEIPEEIVKALKDDKTLKFAHNAAFERVCLSRYLGMETGEYLNPDSWRCTMVWCGSVGLPLSLDMAGKALGLKAEDQKMAIGKRLIRKFCKPQPKGYRILPKTAPEDWELFKAYNAQDVVTELAIYSKLRANPLSDKEWEYYAMDQRINDRGILIDLDFVNKALELNNYHQENWFAEAQRLTGLINPNSALQLKEWLQEHNIKEESLDKAAVQKLLDDEALPEAVKKVLELRQKMSKTSTKKFEAMAMCACSDGRSRGTLQFCGAPRTGRFAGRLIQVQNMPQTHGDDLDKYRNMIKEDINVADKAEAIGDYPINTLCRTAFIPKPGCKFFVADYSAIEARILAWLTGEEWRNRVFAENEDIYCASAASMFHVPVEKNGINGHLRQKGKIAELALGYGGSVGALKSMGALNYGLTEEELQPLVDKWREANPHIVSFWYDLDKAAVQSLQLGYGQYSHGIKVYPQNQYLAMVLPSGREILYREPQLTRNRFGFPALAYKGIGPTRKWQKLLTYGAKLTENLVQATARDLLVEAMARLEAKGYNIVFHVHDEVIVEARMARSDGADTEVLQNIIGIMCESPTWAKGLVLAADGDVLEYYRKA